ncbi:MAG: GAF domain-containing protein [Anaerolineae bacterium]|nr:GAF domain-containing protein [Anaerolineae bacterium]
MMPKAEPMQCREPSVADLETASTTTDTAFLQSTVAQAALLLRASGCAFYLCTPGVEEMTLAASQGMESVPCDQQILHRACLAAESVSTLFPGGPAVLAIPCFFHDLVMGVLLIADKNPERAFDQHDISTIQPLADLAAAMLHQARRLQRMTAQFRALHTIDIALTSSLQLDRVLRLILEKAVDLVRAEHGSLRLYNPDTGELVLKAYLGEGWTPEVRAYVFSRGTGLCGWVAEEHKPYLCLDTHSDPRYVMLFDKMRSAVAVPLLTHGRNDLSDDELLGVLLLESARPGAFGHQDVELLSAMAQEAVLAIQNATQHEKLQVMHQALQDEQERRVAAEKWTVMGQAATALAHRINNLVGIVPASASEIRRTLSALTIPAADREWIKDNLGRIERNSAFVLRLANALFRPFQDAGPKGQFDVNQVLNEALQAANLAPDVQVICDYAPVLPRVESSSLLVDIFLELITNACKAMEHQPRKWLELQTRVEPGEFETGGGPAGSASGESAAGNDYPIAGESGQWAVVEVRDTGTGIPPERLPHLWEMFQVSSDGLGFGLWWVRTFIERQGGTIACHSRPGEGTTFTIRLPAGNTNQPSP